MSDEEIRDLLDLGAEGMPYGPPIDGEATWAAGRRHRVRYSWGTGLAAAAAAAAIGIVWSQGLPGGDDVTPPPAGGTETPVQPTLPEGEVTTATDDDPDDATGEETESGQGPEAGIPEVLGPPVLVVLSEGEWEPTGQLTPLTAQEAQGRRWLPVTTDSESPEVGTDPGNGRGLSFDGDTWRIRDCGIDISGPGTVEDGRLMITGELTIDPDPDPGAACLMPVTSQEWAALLTGGPQVGTDGEILVLSGGTGQEQLEPAGLALVPDGVSDPRGGPVSPVSAEDLAAGLTELSAEQAAGDVGVSDLRDPQPDHATSLSMQDGVVTVDVGCAEPLTGPAWFSQVGPEDYMWQLTAALPADPDCAGPSAQDAELWRQMLARGAFLHRFGDYVVVDAWADPAVSGPVLGP